jgi:hypothetical protein
MFSILQQPDALACADLFRCCCSCWAANGKWNQKSKHGPEGHAALNQMNQQKNEEFSFRNNILKDTFLNN